MNKGILASVLITLALPAAAAKYVDLDQKGVKGVLDADAGLVPLSRDAAMREFPQYLPPPMPVDQVPPAPAELGVTRYRADVFGLASLVYQNIDGKAVFEGDMVIGNIDEVNAAQPPLSPGAMGTMGESATVEMQGAGERPEPSSLSFGFGPIVKGVSLVFGSSPLDFEQKAIFFQPDDTVWYTGTIPYCLIDGFSKAHRAKLQAQIDAWNLKAGLIVRFVPSGKARGSDVCPDQTTKQRVRFVPYEKEFCLAETGRFVNREQYVWIHPDCSARNILHELAHVAGMLHEHTRRDRDNWISVVESNIQEGKKGNFEQKQILPTQGVGEYDYASLMHYSLYEFARDTSRPTLIVLHPERAPKLAEIGNVAALSEKDLAGLNEKYRRARGSQKATFPDR